MKIVSVIKIILLVGVLAIGLFLFIVWWGLYRTQSTDISELSQYAEIIGKELKAEHKSYIALNYKHHVNENSYRLQMHDRFFEGSGDVHVLPVGTTFKLEGAKSFYNPVSGYSHNYVLGSVFITELNQEVKFEFYWGDRQLVSLDNENENYFLFDLAPWQKEALPFKYYSKKSKEPYVWPPRIRNYDFFGATAHFVTSDDFQMNRNFENYYEKSEDYGLDKVYLGSNSQISEENIKNLKLNETYTDYDPNSGLYTFHYDYRVALSQDFISLVVTLFKGKYEMESQLINYDLDGNILGNLKISYDEIAEGMSKRESTFEGNTITVHDNIELEKINVTTTLYQILEDGKIIKINADQIKP